MWLSYIWIPYPRQYAYAYEENHIYNLPAKKAHFSVYFSENKKVRFKELREKNMLGHANLLRVEEETNTFTPRIEWGKVIPIRQQKNWRKITAKKSKTYNYFVP